MKQLRSPCVEICKIDDKSRFCIGCHRTLSEIAAWPGLSENDKHILLNTLEQRARDIARRKAAKGLFGFFR